MKKLALALAACAVASTPAVAADKEVKHIAGVFLGATKIKSETDFSYGLEYEYKLTDTWGVGAVYEKTDDAHHGDGVTVQLVSLYAHLKPSWRLGLGFGKEKVGGHHPHSENLVRASVAYDFHVGDFGIAPTFAVDFVDGEKSKILGVAITRAF